MSASQFDLQTICAVATPPGVGGIAVIRVSGPASYRIVQKLARFLPEVPQSHVAQYGFLRSLEGRELDECLVTCFTEKKSFTGELCCEISCHGNPLICQLILDALVEAGARLARSGEFTYRAFANGRVDLVQAESVHVLVQSRSELERSNALKQLRGGLSEQVLEVERLLTRLLAHIEADIDFSLENLATMDRPGLERAIGKVRQKLQALIQGHRRGRVISQGYRLMFLGRPNVGKSSLFNLVLKQDRAIVAEAPGTTRDFIEAWIELSGVRVAVVDSAGVRETSEQIEAIGIGKTWQQSGESDLLFWVVEADAPLSVEDQSHLTRLKAQKRDVVVVANKTDRGTDPGLTEKLANLGLEVVSVSARNVGARDILLKKVESRLGDLGGSNQVVVSQTRHLEALTRAEERVVEAEGSLSRGVGSEFFALPLKEALLEVQQVLGLRYDDQIIDQIFKEFCLGK